MGSGCRSRLSLIFRVLLKSSRSAILKLKDRSGGIRNCGRSILVIIGKWSVDTGLIFALSIKNFASCDEWL